MADLITERFVFNSLPANETELKALPEFTLDTPYKTAARVLAANGIKVYIFPTLMPTPVLSFAVPMIMPLALLLVWDVMADALKMPIILPAPENVLSRLAHPASDVISLTLSGDDRFIVRPSGTEPKLKAYLFTRARTAGEAEGNLDRLQTLVEQLCG